MKFLATILTFAALLPAPTLAAVCVQVEPDRDMLDSDQQRASELMIESLMAEKGKSIARSGETCTETYLVSHIRFGYTVTVAITGPDGTRQATVNTIDELPGLYSQMVNALLSGDQLNNSNSTVTRRNVTPTLSYQPRVEAEGLWFIRLGYTGIASASAGPTFGFGYRYELDTMGVEVAFLEFMRGNTSRESLYASNTDFGISWIKLMGLKYIDATSQRTPVVGAGLSWHRTQFYTDESTYDGGGIQLHLRGGVDLLRASSIRMFVQLEAGIPLYEVSSTPRRQWNETSNMYDETTIGGSKWSPSLTLALGIGWAKSNY